MQNTVDMWSFIDISYTLITQVDVDFWIFGFLKFRTLRLQSFKKLVAEHRGFVEFSILIFHV